MQLKNILVLAFASAAIAAPQDNDDNNEVFDFDNLDDRVEDRLESIYDGATSKGKDWFASITSEINAFTSTASPDARVSSLVDDIKSEAGARLSSIESRLTGTPSLTPVATITTTNAAGETVVSTSLSAGVAPLPTGAIGAMLFGGAAVFAAM
ncbi:hypothetical protein LZ554_000796 [Drepanopeziza brunnea f. sp. 'monogermtubi']|nr:hypothetical protein LZ554_000796 [Drepanopeziza brunnea f. sp. 'monogermtubi']